MNKELKVGDIVQSLQGHDMGNRYLVISIEKKGYVMVVDGKYRLKDNPKLKNPIHLKFIGHSENILERYKTITDTEMYKCIKNYEE